MGTRLPSPPTAGQDRSLTMNERPTSGSRLDPWVDSYAQRAKNVSGSAIRALFSVASRPEVVSLAGGGG